MRSEEYLTSPPVDSLQRVRGGESPFRVEPQDVRNGDRLDTDERGSEPPGGKDVVVCYGTVTIDSTMECAALQRVHDSFGHRLSHHWDVLQHVDGSATVRENGCLSTATPSTGNGSLATTLPSGRGRGATCAKVWNVVN